jgi:hypothetical protein
MIFDTVALPNPFVQILALASLAMALLPIGYHRSMPFAREGITTTIGFQVILAGRVATKALTFRFQMLAAVLSIRVRESPDEQVGRLEDRIMDWMSQASASKLKRPHASSTPHGASSFVSASALSSTSPPILASSCEMLAMVFMFKSLPALISPDRSNILIIPAIHSVRLHLLQYFDKCAGVGHSRASAGSDISGEGADALYLCLLSLVFQPGDRELQKRLVLSTSVLRDADATAEDSEEVSSRMTVEDIVMILLSKLEPSGVLDRCDSFFHTIFLRTTF